MYDKHSTSSFQIIRKPNSVQGVFSQLSVDSGEGLPLAMPHTDNPAISLVATQWGNIES